MNNPITVIAGGALLTPFERYGSARLVIRDGVVQQAGAAGDIAIPPESDVIELADCTLVPGFIDPHIHGSGGADVMEGTFDAVNTVSRAIARAGVTAFLPTTVSAPVEDLNATVEALGRVIAQRDFGGAQPIGIHMEGPFINPVKRGAHAEASVLSPDPASAALLDDWFRRSGQSIRLVTFAPELSGAEAIMRAAAAIGFHLAMGHSNASARETTAAADQGARYAVHTFNAMSSFTHREPGMVGAVLTDDRIYTEIIADGIHVAPRGVRVLARCKGRDRVILVTDATAAAGMPDGIYKLGRDTLQVMEGVCRNSEGRLAGSALRLDIALANYMNWTGAPLEDALLAVTVNPARALGLEGRGVIGPGMQADIVALDRRGAVAATFVRGREVFRASGY